MPTTPANPNNRETQQAQKKHNESGSSYGVFTEDCGHNHR